MKQPVRRLTLCVLASLAIAFFAAATPAAEPRFAFSAWGSFQRMHHRGDTRGQVPLSALPQHPGAWGVGALAGLRGEVLLYDGRLLVSRGTDNAGRTSPPEATDEAVLFAAARVEQWVDVPVPADMGQAQFEAFVRGQAAARGLDGPFPFLVRGRFPKLAWHVLAGPAAAASGGAPGHAAPHSAMHRFEQPGASGDLVGIYSGEALEGVVSHPGERFHVHFTDDRQAVAGHVDGYSVSRGALLRLPLR
jgi:alpha-acetolactate decarboxylase